MMENSAFEIMRKEPLSDLPITVSDAKSFIGIKADGEDTVVRYLISMSTEYAQWFMERSLIKQKWLLTYCGTYVPKKIYLPFGPLLSVESINTIDKKHKIEIVSSNNYRVHTALSCIEFVSTINTKRVEITYTSGYESAVSIPAQVKYGILYHTAISYKNRSGMDGKHLSFIKDIYQPFKEVRLVLS